MELDELFVKAVIGYNLILVPPNQWENFPLILRDFSAILAEVCALQRKTNSKPPQIFVYYSHLYFSKM